MQAWKAGYQHWTLLTIDSDSDRGGVGSELFNGSLASQVFVIIFRECYESVCVLFSTVGHSPKTFLTGEDRTIVPNHIICYHCCTYRYGYLKPEIQTNIYLHTVNSYNTTMHLYHHALTFINHYQYLGSSTRDPVLGT